MKTRILSTFSSFVFATAVTASASAQAARTLDRGSFSISINGQRVGREDFTISGTPGASGMEYLSKATVTWGDRRLTPSLWSDSSGAPSRYRVEVKGTSGSVERWMGNISRGRVSAQINTPRGEADREYVVADGAILLDDDVFHQYYFVALRANGATVPIVVPRRNTQLALRVSNAGNEPVSVGGTSIEARHLQFTEPSGVVREVWVDSAGRVLKVAIPSRGIIALRDDPPAA
jgi:hypothetical protein